VIKKPRLLRVLLLTTLAIILASPLLAQSNSSSVFRFLDVPPNARAAAMAGNHVALFDADFSLFQVNPAYLNGSSSGRVSASYVNYLADANFGFASGAWHMKDIGTIGAGIRYSSFGEFDRLDEQGNKTGTFNANDIALTLGLGRQLLPKLRAGVSADLIYSSLDSFNSSAAALSAGIIYENPDQELTVGAAIRNAGAQFSTFNGRQEPLPLDIAVEATHRPEKFPVRVSLMLRRLNDWDLRIPGETSKPDFTDNLFRHVVAGGEILFTEHFIFRMGYNQFQHELLKTRENFDLAGTGFGLGIKVNRFFIDISRSSFSELGGIFQLSIKTRIKD